MLINHHLGTGKTLLAIGFAERNPNCSIIILAPSFLHSHWLGELDKYGVKNKKRYRFFSHHSCTSLSQEDLSNTIVIIDESHRFIQMVRSQIGIQDDYYAEVYFNLRNSNRILSLSGTPIYSDTFDLIYQMNLITGKNIFPFNHEKFRIHFSKINYFDAYWKGHLSSSLYIFTLLGGLVAQTIDTLNTPQPLESLLTSYLVSLSLLLFNVATPLEKYPGRSFDISKFQYILQRYVSFYSFDRDTRFYPSTSLSLEKIPYSPAQLNFVYNFYSSKLSSTTLKQLLKDHPIFGAFPDYLTQRKGRVDLNSSDIQDAYKITPGAGREIGNLLCSRIEDGQQKIIIPEKFKRLLSTIEESNGPVVIYTHYYYNGLLYFKQFLDISGYQGNYDIFHPEMSKEEHTKIVNAFNDGKIKILILHPDITEGISLKGVRQLHFLEMPFNSSRKNQIIGRAVRYESHMHLPLSERSVRVFFWENRISLSDKNANALLRKDWHHNFSELNYYFGFGKGRIAVDKNAYMKTTSPDSKAYMLLNMLDEHISDFQDYVKHFSIENRFYYDAL